MATPNLGPYVQDLPPHGGYPKIVLERRVPALRGPPTLVVLATAIAGVAYGFNAIAAGNQKMAEEKMLNREFREGIASILQAEETGRTIFARKLARAAALEKSKENSAEKH